MRGTGSKKASKEAIHMVSAFAAHQRLVLAQVKVNEKSNEIVAIPALLDMLAIEGAVITIDANSNKAWGCQRDIATKIIAKKADYILALKGNQTTLHADVELFINEQKTKAFADTTISTHETVDADHGRVETRKYTAIHDVAWLQERHKWPGLKGLLMVTSQRGTGGQNRTRNPSLHHITEPRSQTLWADDPRSLGHRERTSLGHGHDIPRR